MSPRRTDFRLTLVERLRAITELASYLALGIPVLVYCGVKELIKPKCPRCRKRLATARAEQCLHCGMDWHQRPRPNPSSQDLVRWRNRMVPRWHRKALQSVVRVRDGSKRLSILIDDLWYDAVWRARRSRWHEEIAWKDAGVAPHEVLALKELIQAIPDIDPRIIAVRRVSCSTLEITTGWLGGPLIGAGQNLRARQQGDRWIITQLGGWVA